VIMGTSAIVRVAERRLRSRAARAGFRLCPDCMYELAELKGKCPECGRPYLLGEVQSMWIYRGPSFW
jgi:hypothetical protein